MPIKIMIAIQKGGCGKSTTTSVIAEILATSGDKVLVIDLDSQGNATQMLTQKSIYEFSGNTVLEALKALDPNPYIYGVKENLHLIPAEDELATFSRWLYANERATAPEDILHSLIENLDEDYDFVLMDCPPNIGDIVINATRCADYIFIPVQPEPFAMDALDRFIRFIKGAQESGYTNAQIIGIVYTMIDGRSATQKAIMQAIKSNYKNSVFSSEVRLRAKIKDYALLGVQMERKSDMQALEDYIKVTEELISRVKEQNK